MTYKKAAVVMVLACSILISSCNRRDSGGSYYIDRDNFNELGTFPLVKEQETITIMTYNMGNDSLEDRNLFTRYYEEKTNVRVNWILVPLSQFKERVNLALASGDQIDLIISGENSVANFNNMEIMRMAEQRMILPVQDLIEEETIWFKQRLNEHEAWRDLITLPDGNIYILPSLQGCYPCQYYGKMFVNMEFLRNLNLPVPSTTEEFKQMLIAFRDRDANGNGNPNDEIPLMGATDNFGSRLDTYLISAFIFNDGENRLMVSDDGNVIAVFAHPQFREGLRFIKDLFNENLISRDSFTASRAVRAQLNSSRYESIIGAMPNFSDGQLGIRETGQPVRFIDYDPIPPLEGPDGLRVGRFDPYEAFTLGGVIPATSKNPPLVMRFLDWFMSDEGTLMLGHCQKDIGWTDPDPGATGPTGEAAQIKPIILTPDNPNFGNIIWGYRFPVYRSLEFLNGIQVPDDPMAPDGSGRTRKGELNNSQNYVPWAVDIRNILPPLYYSNEHRMEITTLMTTINTYVNESIARFIVGDMNIETGWDAYITNLHNLGLQRYLEIIQETYNNSPITAKIQAGQTASLRLRNYD